MTWGNIQALRCVLCFQKFYTERVDMINLSKRHVSKLTEPSSGIFVLVKGWYTATWKTEKDLGGG